MVPMKASPSEVTATAKVNLSNTAILHKLLIFVPESRNFDVQKWRLASKKLYLKKVDG